MGAPDFTEFELKEGARLFSRPVTFMLGVTALDQLPPETAPEIAFAGRSNVGKSSLLNAVTGRRKLAFTSGEPGRTRELNFFDASGEAVLVDLPGYGYARAPKEIVKRWTALTRDYLRGRSGLKRVFVLIDSRHGVKDVDEGIMSVLDEAAVSYQAVLTKSDKLKAGEAEKRRAGTVEKLLKRPAAHPVVHLTSSSKGRGVDQLRAEIAALSRL